MSEFASVSAALNQVKALLDRTPGGENVLAELLEQLGKWMPSIGRAAAFKRETTLQRDARVIELQAEIEGLRDELSRSEMDVEELRHEAMVLRSQIRGLKQKPAPPRRIVRRPVALGVHLL